MVRRHLGTADWIIDTDKIKVNCIRYITAKYLAKAEIILYFGGKNRYAADCLLAGCLSLNKWPGGHKMPSRFGNYITAPGRIIICVIIDQVSKLRDDPRFNKLISNVIWRGKRDLKSFIGRKDQIITVLIGVHRPPQRHFNHHLIAVTDN